MCFNKKTPQQIINQICNIINQDNNLNKKEIFLDPFHIYQKIDEFSKVEINYKKLEDNFNKIIIQNKKNLQNINIPKDLLLSPTQISQLIINEVKKVNKNRNYLHYVIPNDLNPYDLMIRIKYDPETDEGKLFQQIKKNFGYDYIELKLSIESDTYPFMPPKIEYIKPKIKLPLLLALINLDILKIGVWSPIINLEYFITNLADQILPVIKDNIDLVIYKNSNSNSSFDILEYELIKLASITKESTMNKIDIKIPIPKKSTNNSTSNSELQYWKSGTGYGHSELKDWDIKSYIKEQEIQSNEISEIIKRISKMISNDNVAIINDSVLIKYIISQINGFTMLEYEKSKVLYKQIFNFLENIIGKPIGQPIINTISMNLKPIFDELDTLFKSSKDAMNDESLLQIYCLSNWYVSKYKEPINEILLSTDIKEKYCQIMKSLQFDNYEVSNNHRFFKSINVKPSTTSLRSILIEISSFKKNLPLNWESTIWTRISKNNINLFSFLISGPKDTPYENGLFEFHGYFPEDYPTTVPSVLINTTGGGTVRFNPNLYNCGKVCLSILGTWSGQESEQWNPKTSTFLQVMVSIQSLILVENPYFNEPGYEKTSNTSDGIKKSKKYNDNLIPSTIKFAMIDMIKNPPKGFESVVQNHFQMKKEEIINKNKDYIHNQENKNLIEELNNLLNDLEVN